MYGRNTELGMLTRQLSGLSAEGLARHVF
jgi:hypothetical protein